MVAAIGDIQAPTREALAALSDELRRGEGEITEADLAKMYQDLGTAWLQLSCFIEAEAAYRSALSRYPQDGLLRPECLSYLGVVLRKRGAIREALEVSKRALAGFEALPEADPVRMADCHLHLGHAYAIRHKRRKARQHYADALERYVSVESADGIARCRESLGILSLDKDNPEEALSEFRAALCAYPESSIEQTRCSVHVGNALSELNDHAAAAAEYEKAEGRYRELGFRYEERAVWFNLALVLEEQALALAGDTDLLDRALGYAVRAFLDADDRRFQFLSERDRLLWARQESRRRAELAFRLAARAGDVRLVADLIAVSRGAGILELAPGGEESTTDEGSSRCAADLMLMDAADQDWGRGDAEAPVASSTAVAGLGLDEMFRRRPLPSLRMPDGRIALDRYREPSDRPTINYH